MYMYSIVLVVHCIVAYSSALYSMYVCTCTHTLNVQYMYVYMHVYTCTHIYPVPLSLSLAGVHQQSLPGAPVLPSRVHFQQWYWYVHL